jgi:hypothetical protein
MVDLAGVLHLQPRSQLNLKRQLKYRDKDTLIQLVVLLSLNPSLNLNLKFNLWLNPRLNPKLSLNLSEIRTHHQLSMASRAREILETQRRPLIITPLQCHATMTIYASNTLLTT